MTQTLLFYGDSRAADWPAPDVPGYAVVNRGVGGQTSAEAVAYLDSALAGLQPNIVVVQIGVNDLSMLTFNPNQRAAIVETCRRNIRQLVARLADISECVVLTTIFPIGDAELFFYDVSEMIDALDEVNDFIHALAGPQITIFDAYAVLAADDGLVQPDYALDMLHLNPLGYRALNRALIDVFATLVGPQSPV